MVEVLCHLRDWEKIYVSRIQRMMAEDEPTFESVDDSLWPIDREYHKQRPREVLEDFARHRSRLVDVLMELNVSGWGRHGYTPRQGRVSIGWYADHIAELPQILEGDLDPVLNALIAEDQAVRLASREAEFK